MRLLLGAAAFAALAQAASIPSSDYVVHEKRNADSQLWQKREKVPEDMILPMRIGLKQGNLDRGHDLLMDISSHDSPNYGKYYTAEQVAELFAPSDETLEAVREWLAQAGFHGRVSQSVNKGWLQFDASTAEAERLLRTKFHYFEHSENGDGNIACDEYGAFNGWFEFDTNTLRYHVPEHIVEHIDYITPGIKLIPNGSGARKAKRGGLSKRGFGVKPGTPIRRPLPDNYTLPNPFTDANTLAKCDSVITPACIRALYGIPIGNKAAKGNELGIYESGDVYSQQDLDAFFKSAYPAIPAGTGPTLKSVDGGKAPVSQENAGGESDLDFELAYPIIYPQSTVLFQTDDPVYTADFEKAGLFNNFLDAVDGSYCKYSYDGETGNDPTYDYTYPDNQQGGYKGQLQCGVYKPTNVVSISYGVNEADYSPAYQRRQCQEWMKLGLQGTTVVLASGDSGVGGRYGQGGHANGCLTNKGTVFNPDYPGTCPYFLTVGSTYLPKGANVKDDAEVATTSFPSGGGFSNLYPQPSWQKAAVDAYFANADPTVKAYKSYSVFTKNDPVGARGGIYNRDGRGYPDVSAVGDNILVVTNGENSTSGGTSASAPIWASIITRINEERIAAGKGTVGFVNPVLYQHPEVFHDVTVGKNPACGTDGFIAAKGWDPVTGLGTPVYPALLKLFMGLK